MVYLDHAATSPMHPAAVEAMTAALGTVGNASSLHTTGRTARRRMEESRELIAAKLGARPSEVIFTAGGTESDNLAVKGIYWARRDAEPRHRRIITTAVEHHAVLDAVNWLVEHEGAEVTWLPTAADGSVSAAALRDALQCHDDVALVSVMWANNEVGTVMPIAELAAVAAEFDVPMHSDAVQAVGQLPVAFAASQLSAMSVAAHKFGGPPGAGALLLRRDVGCTPLSHGGGQERDIRSGTPDVAGAVGMATALQLAVDGLEANSARLRLLRDRLIDGVLDQRRGHPPQWRRRVSTAAGQRALHLRWMRRRCAADVVGRQRNRVLHRFGLYCRGRAAVTCAARDGRRRCQRPGVAAVVVGAHQRRVGCRRGTAGATRRRGSGPASCARHRGGRRDEGPRRDERRCRLVGRRGPHGRRRSRRGRRAPGLVAGPGHVAHRLAGLLLQRGRRRCPSGR